MTVKRGTQTFCLILKSLPATNTQLAEKLGCALQQAEQYTRHMRLLRLVHVSEIIKSGSTRTAVFSFGEGPGLQFRNWRVTCKPNVQLIYFASIIRALVHPIGSAELVEETGICRRHMQTALKEMREAKLVRIAAWSKLHNSRVPLYQLGSAPDAKAPPRVDRRVVNAGAWQRRLVRKAQRHVMFAVAGVADRMAA